jgi:hemolysin III
MPTPVFHSYTPGERRADAVVHGLGLACAAVIVPALIVLGLRSGELPTALAISVYALSLLAMLSLSAAYNLVSPSRAKAVLRRLDHSAIFIMIAGTYTPFAQLLIRDDGGPLLITVLWALAAVGVGLSVLRPELEQRVGVPLALGMGWSIVFLVRPLIAKAPTSALALLLAGGMLYTAGVGFHLWKRLKYHNAIWHLFVLVAAVCHSLAVLALVSDRGGG